jgi:hypothetical protein
MPDPTTPPPDHAQTVTNGHRRTSAAGVGPARPRRHRGGRGGYEPRARIVARAERVFELSVAGRSQREISAELGISQPAVCKILRREEDRRMAQLPHQRLRLLPRHFARYELMFRLAYEGLERSRADVHHRRQRQSQSAGASNGDRTSVEVSSRSQAGDPRWLREMARTLEDQRRLFTPTFDWNRLAEIFDDADDGEVRINEAVLDAEERAALEHLRRHKHEPMRAAARHGVTDDYTSPKGTRKPES